MIPSTFGMRALLLVLALALGLVMPFMGAAPGWAVEPDEMLDDPVLEALEEGDRARELVDVVDGGPLVVQVAPLGIGADKTVEIARLELVGVGRERLAVADPEVAGAR